MDNEAAVDQNNNNNSQVFKVLEALKDASHHLQTNSADSNSSAIKALLQLQTETDSILSNDPLLINLSHHLTNLKSLIQTSPTHKLSLHSFLARRLSSHEISRVAASIESEIQSWIDREMIENLRTSLRQSRDEQTLVLQIDQLKSRISQGFNRDLQDLILKSKVFESLESVLFEISVSNKVRESAAFAVAELIQFNKDVFVGQVLMGQTIRSLISLSSCPSLRVLCSLIKLIKSPLVDEIESSNEIPKVICLLGSADRSVLIAAMDCVLEIGYYGRKEAIEAMLSEGLVKRLVELQRGELGGDLIDLGKFEVTEDGDDIDTSNKNKKMEEEEKRRRGRGREGRYLEGHPFASCVARFAVQLEVGEGLRQREKRAFKQQILKGVREACGCDANAATIIAEVLWGSTP